MKKAWPMVSLAELVSLERRPVEVAADREYREIGIYCFGRGIFHKQPRTGLEVGDKKLYQLRERDVILQVTFAWEGAIALCSDKEEGLYGSTRYPTFRVNEESCLPSFLVRYLCTDGGLSQINRICPGSAGRNRVLAIKRLSEVILPLPPVAEQRRIVARIEELQGKLVEARSLRHQAIEEAKVVVTSMHVGLAGGRARRLADLLVLDEDAVPVFPTEHYPQVGVRSFGGGLFRKQAVQGIDTTYRTFNRLYRGSLVLSQVKGWEGAVAVCDASLDGWFVSPEYRTFRCVSSEARPGYLAAVIRTEWFWSKLRNATRGVGARRERTRPEQFLALKIPMPDVHQQEYAEAVFKRLYALRGLQAQTATELDAMLPAILDLAFKGEL